MIDADNDAEHDKGETPQEELLEQAIKDYRVAYEAVEKQLDREQRALRFQVPALQWSDDARRARLGDGIVPPRPMLSVSLLEQPISLIVNQMRQADLGIQVHPVSPDAEDETAETIQGLLMYEDRRCNAEQARAWAFDRSVKAGRGWYRLATVYDNEGGEKGDQRVVVQRILHQEGVFPDPAACEPDYSDARFMFVVAWMTPSQFKAAYPGVEVPKQKDLALWSLVKQQAPEWVRDDDLLVAEYWHREKVGEGAEDYRTYCCKLCGWQVLEEPQEFPAPWIPIIPALGRELQPFDEERRYMGIIEPAMDPQQLHNYACSTMVENMAAEPRAPFIGYAGQFEGFEDQWRQVNVRNFPYLEVNPVVDAATGQMLPLPQRVQVDSSKMQLSLMAIQEARNMTQTATAIFDASLGKIPDKERSGKAILALQQQSDAGTSVFIQNFADISMQHEARIRLALYPKIYDRPGRVARVLRGDDKKTEAVMLGAPFVVDPRTKRPMPAPPGQRQGVKNYDLTKGSYAVSVTVGKSFQTRLAEGSDRIGQLIQAEPALFPAIGDIYLRYQDWPGSQEIADRVAKLRDKQFPGIADKDDEGPSPEMLKGKLEQQGQMMQAMQQQMQAMGAALEGKQMELQAKVQIAEMQRDTQLRKTAADNETKLAIAGLEARMAQVLELLSMEHEARKLQRMQAHDMGKVVAGHAQAERQRTAQEQHEVAMAELGRPAPEEPAAPEGME